MKLSEIITDLNNLKYGERVTYWKGEQMAEVIATNKEPLLKEIRDIVQNLQRLGLITSVQRRLKTGTSTNPEFEYIAVGIKK